MSRLKDGPSSSSKRPRRGYGDRPRRKRHIYLATDDWKGGYSIHKLDADDIWNEEPDEGGELHKLPEPAAIRIASPGWGPMGFTALGTNIFIATSPRCRPGRAPPTFVYNTETAALSVGPRLPDMLDGLSAAVAVGDRLYAVPTDTCFLPSSLQVLSLTPTPILDPDPCDPDMVWSWKRLPEDSPINGSDVASCALHPDGHTIFMSTGFSTCSFDTSSGVWKKHGDWMLPFSGQAYFDADLDAWVGLHRKHEGYVCCCPVVSPSTTTTRPPECIMLKEKLFRLDGEERYLHAGSHLRATLTYMGDSRFCLVECILLNKDFDAVLHVTLFGLKYDHKGELQLMIRTTRSYAISKSSSMFPHAAFWM